MLPQPELNHCSDDDCTRISTSQTDSVWLTEHAGIIAFDSWMLIDFWLVHLSIAKTEH